MSEYKIGVVGIPGKWSTEVLAEAVRQHTSECPVIDMADVWLDLTDNRLYYQDLCLSDFDALIIKKISLEYNPNTLDRLEQLRMIEGLGVRIFSPASNIMRLIDRLSCTVTLRQHDIPMPPTVITESEEKALDTVQRFGESVFKPLFSTKARGMEVIKASDALDDQKTAIAAFKSLNPTMYIQKKLALPGKDMGMVFLAGEYLGTYARVSQNDSWNTTILSGGRYENIEPSQDIIELGRRAQAPFNMDFTTVDIAESEIGPIVFEVSAFGGFRGAKEGVGIDAASLYVEHVIRSLDKGAS